jgi:hypothetical protein
LPEVAREPLYEAALETNEAWTRCAGMGGTGGISSSNWSPLALPSSLSGPLTPIRYGGPPDLLTRKFGLGAGGLELRRWTLDARPEDDEPGRATSARPPFGAVLGRPRLLDRKRDTADGNAGAAADFTLGAWVEDWASRSRAVRLSSLRVLGPLPRTGREPRGDLVSTCHVNVFAPAVE